MSARRVSNRSLAAAWLAASFIASPWSAAAQTPAAAQPSNPAQPPNPAQTATPAQAARAAPPTDAKLGAQLATQGVPGVAACSGCHGAHGEGMAASGFPRLAGQPADYLQHQLEAYADDTRRNPIMQPIAKAMNPAQRAAAAGYYAAQAPTGAAARSDTAGASAPPPSAATRRLTRVGDEGRGIQGCANCHGPDGIGEWPYPSLAGQHATYLQAALAEWKDGSRNTDPSGQMQRIAAALTTDEMAALSAYFAALPAPPPRAASARAAAPGRARPAVVSGPATAQPTPSQGVGSEQGSPVGGGGQGNGSVPEANGPPSGAPASAPNDGRR